MHQFIGNFIAWLFIGIHLGIKWEEHGTRTNSDWEYGIKLTCAIIFCPLVLLAVIVNQVFVLSWK